MLSYVCSICACLDLSVSSSSWYLGKAAVYDCGTPWTFLLPFFEQNEFEPLKVDCTPIKENAPITNLSTLAMQHSSSYDVLCINGLLSFFF